MGIFDLGVFDLIGDFISFGLSLNIEILLILVLIGAFIAFKLFSFVMKAVMTGVVFALFPLVANYFGIPIPITIHSLVSYALLGIIFFLGYGMIKFGFKATRLAMSPFKRSFKNKKKVVEEKEKT